MANTPCVKCEYEMPAPEAIQKGLATEPEKDRAIQSSRDAVIYCSKYRSFMGGAMRQQNNCRHFSHY